jgi:energy-converting hydrogenase Eha subunit A
MNDHDGLLLENYRVLHESVQNSHKYSWTLTSIFVPLIFASIAFLFNSESSIGKYFFLVLSLGIVVTLLFWLFAIRFLENCNKLRTSRLRQIEEMLSPVTSESSDIVFNYYRLFEKSREIVPHWFKYKRLLNGYAIAIITLLSISVILKLAS